MPLDEEDSPQRTSDRRAERSHSPSALDWPLSREEKKTRVLQLYDRDTRAADQLLRTGEEALEALRVELRRIRETFPKRRDDVARQTQCDKEVIDESDSGSSSPERTPVPHPLDEANAALFKVVSDASSVLAACLTMEESQDLESASPKPRAKSEGQRVLHPLTTSRRPRRSRGGDSTPKRVSFADDTGMSDTEEDMAKRPPPPSVPPPPPPPPRMFEALSLVSAHPRGRLPPCPQQPIPGGQNDNMCQLSAFISGPVPQFFVKHSI